MSESVSGVDAIVERLRKARTWVNPGRPPLVYFEDAEAAVHATAQKYEAALARQGAMLDRCRDERLSWEDVEQQVVALADSTSRLLATAEKRGAATTAREIEAMLRAEFQRFSEDSMATDEDLARRDGLLDAADEVARQFGGTDA